MFESAFGMCGIAWSGRGLCAVLLPGRTVAETEQRLRDLGAVPFEDGLPSAIGVCVERLLEYFRGSPVHFGDAPLDFQAANPAYVRIYRSLQTVPWGTTTTYEALAREVDMPNAARTIGTAMARNPWPVVVPCHRVLGSDGGLGGFSAPGGRSAKEALLRLERARGITWSLFD